MPAESSGSLPEFLAPLFWNTDREPGFYFAGGTAVALQIGRRRPVDFDWFAPRFPGRPVDLRESLASRGIALEPVTGAGSFARHTRRQLIPEKSAPVPDIFG